MADENAQQGSNDEKPKIFVDDDWKTQVQAEKEKLTKEAQQKQPSQGAQPGGQGGPRQLPEASFPNLVNQIAMQAMLALGGMEDPQTKRRMVDLGVAKFHIDTLDLLREKTQGNTTEEEQKLLDQALYELRNAFVQISQNARPARPDDFQQQDKTTPPPDNA
jgi:hypothetical protein